MLPIRECHVFISSTQRKHCLFSYGKRTLNFKFFFLHIKLMTVKEDEVGRSCSTNGGDEDCI
jgi:hypothetical protein